MDSVLLNGHTFFFFCPVETTTTKDVNTVFLRVDIFLDDSEMIVYKDFNMCVSEKLCHMP